MSRVLVPPNWYETRTEYQTSRSAFSGVLERFAQHLFAQSHFAKFDLTFQARGEVVHPDFVLVAHDG